MKKLLSDRQGATSVLVIFMMIVLVVFATLAFTTSYANYRLSQKSAVITQENYMLDALAMRMTMKVDICLADAETRAQEAMTGNALEGRIEGLTAAQGAQIRRRVESDGAGFAQELMNRLYLRYALEEIQALTDEYKGIKVQLGEGYEDGDFLDITRPAPDAQAVRVTMALTTGGEVGDKQLDVVLALPPLDYELKATGASVTGERAEGFLKRYRIDSWKQWQIPFEYDDRLEFGDARITIGD